MTAFKRLLNLETRINMANLFIDEIDLRMPMEHELDHLCEVLTFDEERRLRYFINTQNRAGVVNTCMDIDRESKNRLRELLRRN